MRLGTLIPHLKKIQKKKYKSHDTPLDFRWHRHRHRHCQKSTTSVILINADKDYILMQISISFNFEFSKVALIKMVVILMMSAKLATLSLLKIKVTWIKGYDAIVFVHDVTNNILWRYSNYIVDVVIWPELGNCNIFMTEVITTLIL